MDETGRKRLWMDYAKSRATDIREKLILEYSPLVKVVAGRLSMYLGYNVEYDDLVGYGIFGLIDAIDKFDPTKEVKFETYASLRIRGSILDQIRKMDWIPRTIRQKQKKIETAIKEIEDTKGRPATAYVTMCVELNNGQGMDSFSLTRKWVLNESLTEIFSVLKNGVVLTEDEIADFDKYIVSIIPPELFNLYFFDGEKIADFFMDEGSSSRIKEAFLTLCGYDTFDIMRKNFKRISAGSSTTTPALEEYISAKEALATAESMHRDLNIQLKGCIDAIADCEAALEAQEKEYYQKGGITEKEWNQKLYTLKEEEKKRETYNALLKKWANDVIPFIMLRKQIIALKKQMNNENQALKYSYFCEVLNSPAVRSLIKDKLEEINNTAFSIYGTDNESILNLSLEQNTLLLTQINRILSFAKNDVKKCKKAIKHSLNITANIRKELDGSSVTNVQEYMKRRAQLFEEKSSLLVQRIELEQQLAARSETLTLAEQHLRKVQARLEEELKKASINDISARAIVMLDKLQEILYRRQIDKVESCFRQEIHTCFIGSYK